MNEIRPRSLSWQMLVALGAFIKYYLSTSDLVLRDCIFLI